MKVVTFHFLFGPIAALSAVIVLFALLSGAAGAQTTSPMVIADFEQNLSGFTGAIVQDSTVSHGGKASARMDANFGTGKDAWTTATKKLDPGLDIKQVSFWIKSSDASGITFRIDDSTGQVLQQRPTFPADGQWHRIVISDFEHGSGMQFYSGANDGKVHWPAVSMSFIFEKPALGGKTAGSLWIDDVEADADPATGPAIAFESTQLGNVFTTDQTIAIPVNTQGDHIAWTVTNFGGDTVSSGNSDVMEHEATIRPDLKGQRGYFKLSATAQSGGS